MAEKVLVVEDEPTLVETLSYNLARQGYAVVTATDGRTALELARRERPDLILLDVMLPELDGIEVCRILRQETAVPIIMLTARDEEIDKVVGLEVGADDYMTKPFSMRELMARVRALLRRVRLMREEMAVSASEEAALKAEAERLVFGDLVLDLVRREALLGKSPLPLKPKEYELLVFLARHRGQALSRDVILERVWGWDSDAEVNVVWVNISFLRKKLKELGAHVEIKATRGVGYSLEQVK